MGIGMPRCTSRSCRFAPSEHPNHLDNSLEVESHDAGQPYYPEMLNGCQGFLDLSVGPVILMTKKLSLDKYASCLCARLGDITSVL